MILIRVEVERQELRNGAKWRCDRYLLGMDTRVYAYGHVLGCVRYMCACIISIAGVRLAIGGILTLLYVDRLGSSFGSWDSAVTDRRMEQRNRNSRIGSGAWFRVCISVESGNFSFRVDSIVSSHRSLLLIGRRNSCRHTWEVIVIERFMHLAWKRARSTTQTQSLRLNGRAHPAPWSHAETRCRQDHRHRRVDLRQQGCSVHRVREHRSSRN